MKIVSETSDRLIIAVQIWLVNITLSGRVHILSASVSDSPYKVEVAVSNAGLAPQQAGAPTGALEIVYGFGVEYAHQLFVGESTELLPAGNLRDVCLRYCANQTVIISCSWFL